jgi:hypothetical protein
MFWRRRKIRAFSSAVSDLMEPIYLAAEMRDGASKNNGFNIKRSLETQLVFDSKIINPRDIGLIELSFNSGISPALCAFNLALLRMKDNDIESVEVNITTELFGEVCTLKSD